MSDIQLIKEALLQFEQELDDKRFEEINESIDLLFKAIKETEKNKVEKSGEAVPVTAEEVNEAKIGAQAAEPAFNELYEEGEAFHFSTNLGKVQPNMDQMRQIDDFEGDGWGKMNDNLELIDNSAIDFDWTPPDKFRAKLY